MEESNPVAPGPISKIGLPEAREPARGAAAAAPEVREPAVRPWAEHPAASPHAEWLTL